MFERRSSGAPFTQAGLTEHQTLVTVKFKPRGSATELVLVQEKVPTSAAEELLQIGWQGILDKLAWYLGRAARSDTEKA